MSFLTAGETLSAVINPFLNPVHLQIDTFRSELGVEISDDFNKPSITLVARVGND